MALALTLAFGGCSPRDGDAPAELPNSLAARREIWAAIQPLAKLRRIDPGFIYAIIRVESNFDPRASRGEAKGLMQIKPKAWRTVTNLPYESMVWHWRTNLAVGIESLASIKASLSEKGVFSYPLLWASYHYGLDFTSAHGFDMGRIPRPSDPVSDKLWTGEVHPLNPPK
jgi:hypothetical protein